MSVLGAILKWIGIGVLVLLACALLLLAKLTWRAYAALPQTEGEIAAPGLNAEARIVRDVRGVPHIFAESAEDAAFAVGFAHAQDRLWQMHVTRWYLRGEVAGVLGSLAAESDARLRTYGLGDAADALAEDLTDEEIAPLAAYAEGVNAAMAADGFVPPLEFLMLGVAPQDWTAADSLLVYKGLALDLMNGEAVRAYGEAVLAGILSPDQIAEFTPPYPDDGPVTLTAADLGLAPAPAAPFPEPGEGMEIDPADAPRDGSNAWVVSGQHTVSGAPLLANDPHLGFRAPGVWYLAAIHQPEGAAVGVTVPGAPAIVMGRNRSIAWGMTITGLDAADLTFAPEDAVTETRTETIPVRFGEDVTLELRRTADGPVLPAPLFNQGELAPEGQLAVLRWPLDDLADRSATAGAAIMAARDWTEFTAALSPYYAPMVNVMFASTDGDIGILSPAFVPVREGDGWAGAAPFEDLPRLRNPEDGVIVNANNRLVPSEYPYALTDDWAPPYRAQRIIDLLDGVGTHSPDSFAAIQTDTVELTARSALPVLLAGAPQSEAGRAAQAMMLDWDGDMKADSAEALIYAAWIRQMGRAVYGDELGEDFRRFESRRSLFLDNVLTGRTPAWCDDTGTDAAETCEDLSGPALDEAAASLADAHGADMADWRWGAAHQAYFGHAPFSAFPVLDDIFSARIEAGGTGDTINESGYSYNQDGFTATHGPSLRAIYDLSDLDSSRFALPMGQSGHLVSAHYRDLLKPWAAGEYFEIRTDWTPDAAPEGAEILTLRPAN